MTNEPQRTSAGRLTVTLYLQRSPCHFPRVTVVCSFDCICKASVTQKWSFVGMAIWLQLVWDSTSGKHQLASLHCTFYNVNWELWQQAYYACLFYCLEQRASWNTSFCLVLCFRNCRDWHKLVSTRHQKMVISKSIVLIHNSFPIHVNWSAL